MGDAEKASDTAMEEALLVKNSRPGIHGDAEDRASSNKEEEGIHISAAEAASLPLWRRRTRPFIEEVKRLGYLAGPMVAVSFSQYMLQVISIMMVGHLGELALSSTAIAVSLAGVTGFSLLVRHLPSLSLRYSLFLRFSFQRYRRTDDPRKCNRM